MKRLWILLLVCGLVVFAIVLFTGYQALRLQQANNHLAADLAAMVTHLGQSDEAGARADLGRAQQHAEDAHHNMSGVGWTIGRHVPGLSDDIAALDTITASSQRVVDGILPGLLDVAPALFPESLQPHDGRVSLSGLVKAAPVLGKINAQFQKEAARVAAVPTANVNPALSDSVAKLRMQLRSAGQISDIAARAARLVPRLMGHDGPRSYLVAFQNNAEVRATGGIPGSFAVLHVRDGRMTLGTQGGAALFGPQPTPALPLTTEERALFQPEMARVPQDVNLTPDFPRAARLLSVMWERGHPAVDGVIFTDPVALSYLLDATGPVALPDGTALGTSLGTSLDADTVLERLLHGVYVAFPNDNAAQDRYFAAAARAVFDATVAGRGDPAKVVGDLVAATSQGRILVWSKHASDRRLIGRGRVSGVLATHRSRVPEVGVYLDDGTGAKMDYYLKYGASLASQSCAGGQQQLETKLVMTSNAPADAATTLPPSVLGPGFGTPPGHLRTTVYFYAPVGGSLGTVLVDGQDAHATSYTHKGREVAAVTVDLDPGETRTFTVPMLTATGQDGDPALRVTPGLLPNPVLKLGKSSCSD